MAHFSYETIVLPDSLTEFVEHCYLLEGSTERPLNDFFYANGSCEIVLNVGVQFQANDRAKSAKFIGQIITPLAANFTGTGMSFGAVLTPRGVMMLLDASAGNVNDTIVPLDQLMPIALVNQLFRQLEHGAVTDLLRLLESFFTQRQQRYMHKYLSVHTFERLLSGVHDLEHHRGAVKHLSQLSNVSERYVHSMFKQYLGINTSTYLQVKRFQFARELMRRDQHLTLTSIAHQAGYYDQSHFTREVKKITHLTPRQLKLRQHALADHYA